MWLQCLVTKIASKSLCRLCTLCSTKVSGAPTKEQLSGVCQNGAPTHAARQKQVPGQAQIGDAIALPGLNLLSCQRCIRTHGRHLPSAFGPKERIALSFWQRAAN